MCVVPAADIAAPLQLLENRMQQHTVYLINNPVTVLRIIYIMLNAVQGNQGFTQYILQPHLLFYLFILLALSNPIALSYRVELGHQHVHKFIGAQIFRS